MSRGVQYDVIVIGGGASGMMAAGTAARKGRRVLLLEKNKELGKKLSITGGGRCNILNAESDSRVLLSHFGPAAKFLHSPFAHHGMQDSWDFFTNLGMPLIIEGSQRAFPESQSAPEVTKLMRKYCTDNNVELKLKTAVFGFIMKDGVMTGVRTSEGDFFTTSIILATGGSSHKETGASSEGVSWLSSLGHTIYEPSPTIVPLKVQEEWVSKVSGVSLSGVKVTFAVGGKNAERFSRTGKLLFTHFGLSGPVILNASYDVQQLLKKGPVFVTLDLFPHTEIGTLRQQVLGVFLEHKNKALKNIMKEFISPRMVDALAAHIPTEVLESRVHSIKKEDREHLADILKALPCTVTGTMGLDWAVISDGGVDLKEVDTRTMASKIIPNLYFSGDVLHINRPSGGFSLQLCWTTGWVAGSNA